MIVTSGSMNFDFGAYGSIGSTRGNPAGRQCLRGWGSEADVYGLRGIGEESNVVCFPGYTIFEWYPQRRVDGHRSEIP